MCSYKESVLTVTEQEWTFSTIKADWVKYKHPIAGCSTTTVQPRIVAKESNISTNVSDIELQLLHSLEESVSTPNKSSDSNWYLKRCRTAMQTFSCSWKTPLAVLLSHLHPSNAALYLPVSKQVIARIHDTEIHMESEIIHVLHCTFSFHCHKLCLEHIWTIATNSAVTRWFSTKKNECGIWNIALVMRTTCIEGACSWHIPGNKKQWGFLLDSALLLKPCAESIKFIY